LKIDPQDPLIGTMSDQKKTSEELESEMDQLVRRMGTLGLQLQETRRRESHVQSSESASEQEQHKALLRKMVGRRVLITVKGPHQGKEGVKKKKTKYLFYFILDKALQPGRLFRRSHTDKSR